MLLEGVDAADGRVSPASSASASIVARRPRILPYAGERSCRVWRGGAIAPSVFLASLGRDGRMRSIVWRGGSAFAAIREAWLGSAAGLGGADRVCAAMARAKACFRDDRRRRPAHASRRQRRRRSHRSGRCRSARSAARRYEWSEADDRGLTRTSSLCRSADWRDRDESARSMASARSARGNG